MALLFVIFICALLAVITLRSIWRYLFIAQVRHVSGGYKKDINLPHTEPVELYFADVSSNSMKVRFCLEILGIEYKKHILKLPSSGSFESKTKGFLEINPAGTVPVLVHNGHPIYESSEQIKYINNELRSRDNADAANLECSDIATTSEVDYWVEKTSMQQGEIKNDMDQALKQRAGNILPFITIPMFAAKGETLPWTFLLEMFFKGSFGPLSVLTIMFRFMGVYSFKFIPLVSGLVKKGKKALLHHLTELEDILKGRNTSYICGDSLTLADVGWAPILERMHVVGWWEHIDPVTFAHVRKYWSHLRSHPSYQEAVKNTRLDDVELMGMTAKVGKWKKEYKWFRDMYDYE